MRKFERLPQPQILADKWKQLGMEYEARRIVNNNYRFNWPQIKLVRLNHSILPDLKNQTDEHCSYCDKYPLQGGDFTIDHFKPKSDPQFYRIVCKWDNLYLACNHCQKAKDIYYSDDILRPDSPDFEFSKYFIYNYNEDKIDVNDAAEPDDQLKAKETIRAFDLNHPGLKTARRHARERFKNDMNPVLTDYNYRFIF